MENNELQEIWKTFDTEINQKSKAELNLLLTSKTRQTMNKFLVIMGISIAVSAGLLIYLAITSLQRQTDLMFLINNATLGIITIISLVSGLQGWYKLQNNKYNQPLKNWLEDRISFLTAWLTGRFSKLYIFLIPVLYVLIVLSIHVYFEHKPFMEVMHTEESVIGLIVAAPIGLFASYFAVRKFRKYQLKNLDFLKDLYTRLCKAG